MAIVRCRCLSSRLRWKNYAAGWKDVETDAPEVIESRIAKAEYELSFASQFDCVIVNDNLETAKAEALKVIKEFLEQ